MKKKLVFNTVSSLLMQITALICGFILPRQILQSYGSEVNGLIHSITQFLSVITFLELGIGQVIQTSLYKPLSQQNLEQVSKVLRSGTVYFRKIAYAFLCYIAVLVVIFPLIIQQQFQWQYTAVLIIAISISSFVQYYFGIIDKVLLNADQRGYIQFTAQIVCTVLNTVISICLIRAGCSIQVVKLTASAIFLLNPIAVRWYIRKHYQIDRKITYDEEPIRQKWSGVAQHVSAVVLEGTDNIVLTLFATLSDVSIYSVYFMVISGVTQLYRAATAGVQSMMGALWAKGDRQQLHERFRNVELVLHFAVVFLFTCICVLIVPFVRVYTHGLTDAQYTQPLFAVILTLAYAVRCLCTPYNIMVLAAGHYKQTQVCHIVATALNIIISIPAVMIWGLIGVAAGTLVAFVFQTLWLMVYNSRHLLKWPMWKIVKHLFIDILTAAAIWFLTKWITLGTVSYWGWFTMAVPVALIALAVTIVMALVFYGKDVKTLLHALSRKK